MDEDEEEEESDSKDDTPEKAGKGHEDGVEGQGKAARSRKSSEEVPRDTPSPIAKPTSRRSSRGWTPKTFENVEPVDLKALLRNKSLLKSNPKPFTVRLVSAFIVIGCCPNRF